MKKIFSCSFIVATLLAQIALGHDPRTVAKEFSHTLNIEGAGKLTLTYKSLHWNEPGYNAAKQNPAQRQRLNDSLWKKIGTLQSDFDVVLGGVPIHKGSYSLGINFDGNDNFKLVLIGDKEIDIPLQTTADSPEVTYLSFDLRPTSDTDSFVLEGRSGKFRCSAEVKVPYLAPHEHPEAAHPEMKKPN